MRTADAQKSVRQLAKVYRNLHELADSSGNEVFICQSDGIELAVFTLGLDYEEFKRLIQRDETIPTGVVGDNGLCE